MKKIIVTLCSLALSLAGTFGINQLASNDEAIIDMNKQQVNIEQDADTVEDKTNLPTEMEIQEKTKEEEDKTSKVEELTPKAEDAAKENDESKQKDIEEEISTVKNNNKKEEKKPVNKKSSKPSNSAKQYTDNNTEKQYTNNNTLKQNNKKKIVTNNNSQNKASDYINKFRSNGNNVYVYKNVDLSNCESTQDIVDEVQKKGYENININNIQNISSLQDILSLINGKGNQDNTKPTPTKPTPTTAPTKPTPTTAPTKPAPTSPPTNSGSNQNFADEVLRLVNIERSKAGLSSLTTNATLKAAADKRAQETEISFSHTRPNGSKFSTVLQEYGISYRTAGENIAYGQRSPQEVVNGWMNSPGHRANILNASFGKIGIGVYQSKGVIYWSQLFTN